MSKKLPVEDTELLCLGDYKFAGRLCLSSSLISTFTSNSSDQWYLDVGYGKPRSNPFPHVAGAGYNHWNRVYSYDMRTNLTEAEADLLIGGEVTMWSELADETNFEAKIWPRVRKSSTE